MTMMDRLIEAMQPLIEGNSFLSAPPFQARLLLRDKLIPPFKEVLQCEEAARDIACSITARMDVEVNEAFIEHPRRDELLDIFATLVVKAYKALRAEGYSVKDFEAMMSQMDLKYTF